MDQTVNAVFNLDERAEVSQISHSSVNARADLITLVQRLPRVLLNLLHAETDAPCFRIDAQYFDFHQVARIDDFARMLHTLGPAHLGDVHQSFDTGLEFDERAVIGNARNPSGHSRADREAFFHAGPRIGQQLLVAERNAFAFAIELQHLDLNGVADFEQLVRIL